MSGGVAGGAFGLDRREVEDKFRDAIRAAGLTPPQRVVADGVLRRFATDDRHVDKAGWYRLYGDAIPAGAFGCWRRSFQSSWRADVGRKLTPQEEAEHRARMDSANRLAHEQRERERSKAQNDAEVKWSAAVSGGNEHPYLVKKGVEAHGLRVLAGNSLLIPMRDADGTLHSLQTIADDNEQTFPKRFLKGGRTAGCFHVIGEPTGVICIAEGYATAATVHEATGVWTVVAFNAGNLCAVAEAVRAKYPDAEITMCADDDESGVGVSKATEAARAVGARVELPDWGGARPEGATDFNDLMRLQGRDAVRASLLLVTSPASRLLGSGEGKEDDEDNDGPELDVLSRWCPQCRTLAEYPDCASCGYDFQSAPSTSARSDVTSVTNVTPFENKESFVTSDLQADVTAVTSTTLQQVPDIVDRPRYCVFDEWVEEGGRKYKAGVWYFGLKAGKDDAPDILIEDWICSPLHVEAVTYDEQDNNFGRLLKFKNTLGRWREWAMPMELLRASGDELRGELLAMGVEIDPKSKHLLATYLQSKPPKRRMRCALQVGWSGDSFVLPDAVIGPSAAEVTFQSAEHTADEHTRAGSLVEWKAGIAARAEGNPLLTLALSAAFAGPILGKCNAESGGIHFVGDSSTGKTTAIEAACSVWGGTNFRRSWRATANGMEGVAALFNDCLLALDEISECDPKEVGAIIYALGNGRGKQRATRTGQARGVTRWRCSVLSSGERTIQTTMEDAGQRAKAGQSVRLLNIPAARRYGAWDELHGMPTGAAFSDALKRAAATHYGHAGRTFLERLTRDRRELTAMFEQCKARPEFATCGDDDGQDKRAAARFALYACAGELATEYGITGWAGGTAIKAASEGFRAWSAMRGRGNDEQRQIVVQVSEFIDRHGDGRFSSVDECNEQTVRDRAGWWRDGAVGRIYLFTSQALREAVKGFDFKRALDLLQAVGALVATGQGGERSQTQRIGGRIVRVYSVLPDRLMAAEPT